MINEHGKQRSAGPKIAIGLLLTIALCGCGLARNMLYAPRSASSNGAPVWHHGPPAAVVAHSTDNLVLRGYYWPGSPGDRDVIVFFHGRHFNTEIAAKYGQYLVGMGNGILVAGYRGFSGNPGRPSEAGLRRDAAAFLAEARTLAGPDTRLWLVGHSIGAAVALATAGDDPRVAGVFTLSAFTRVAAAAPRITRAFIPDRWDNVAALRHVRAPVIILQGALDPYVEPGDGQALFSAATGPAALIVGAQARHNPDMPMLGSWINRAIAGLEDGGIATLPSPPAGWVEEISRP